MSTLDDMLIAAGITPPAAPADNSTPPPAPDPNAVTQVAPLTVRPDGDPNKPIPYDNSRDRAAMNASMADTQKPSGIWGLLPDKVQHGALRDVLGAIGDAYLQAGGHDDMYGPRKERQQAGQALAGYANKPEAAIERFQATGYPGSIELGAKMQDNLTSNNLRADTAAANQQYHQDTLDLRKDNQDAQAKSRDDNVIARMAPVAGGLLSQAKTAAEYAAAYEQTEKLAQRINPRYHAEDLGAIPPEFWRPGMNMGITGGQQQSSEDRVAGQGVSVQNNAASNAARIQAARISAGTRVETQGATAVEADVLQKATRQGIDSLNPAERDIYNRATHIADSSSGGGLHSNVAPTARPQAPGRGGTTPARGSTSQFVEGQVYTDKHGNRGRWTHGQMVPIK